MERLLLCQCLSVFRLLSQLSPKNQTNKIPWWSRLEFIFNKIYANNSILLKKKSIRNIWFVKGFLSHQSYFLDPETTTLDCSFVLYPSYRLWYLKVIGLFKSFFFFLKLENGHCKKVGRKGKTRRKISVSIENIWTVEDLEVDISNIRQTFMLLGKNVISEKYENLIVHIPSLPPQIPLSPYIIIISCLGLYWKVYSLRTAPVFFNYPWFAECGI